MGFQVGESTWITQNQVIRIGWEKTFGGGKPQRERGLLLRYILVSLWWIIYACHRLTTGSSCPYTVCFAIIIMEESNFLRSFFCSFHQDWELGGGAKHQPRTFKVVTQPVQYITYLFDKTSVQNQWNQWF
jgi:hypothetical protein